MLRRACRLSTAFATATKRHEIARLREAYCGGVNFYVGSLWQNPGALVLFPGQKSPRINDMVPDRQLGPRIIKLFPDIGGACGFPVRQTVG